MHVMNPMQKSKHNYTKQLKCPWILKPFSPLIKSFVKRIVYFRLRSLPLSYYQAEWWANVCKEWPAIFNEPFIYKKKLPAGMLMELGIVDIQQRMLLTQGKYEVEVEKLLRHYLKKGDVFLDIGANIGYFSLMASGLVGDSGKVVACEPSIRALARLTANLCINQCSNVILFSIGSGEIKAIETLFLASEGNIGMSSLRSIKSVSTERIPIMRVDDLLESYNVTPKVVKIDVEGGELSTLKGMKNILEDHHPIVICELCEEYLQGFGVCMKDVLEWMEALGYRGYLVEDKGSLKAHPVFSYSTTFPSSYENFAFTIEEPEFAVNIHDL